MTWASDLHFCWLIEPWKKSREQYLLAWQKLGWHCVLWHSGQIKEPPVPGVELRLVDDLIAGSDIEEVFEFERRHGSHASCADLFRYFVLYKLGGAYADIDVWPASDGEVSSGKETEHPLFGIPTPGSANLFALEIRFIRSPQGHILLRRLCNRAVKNEKRFIRTRGYVLSNQSIISRTGPAMATGVVQEYARETGISFSSFLILATLDNTLENGRENHGVGLSRAKSVAYRRGRLKKRIFPQRKTPPGEA